MYKLPETIKADIEHYGQDLESYLLGKLSLQKFRALRVAWGVYSQRKERLFMVRVRIVAGKIYLHQLKRLAEVAKEYGTGVLHVTTRQDMQIHNIKIENTLKVIKALAEVGLSPRAGGGNTIRNILSCPLSGICPQEVFDASGDTEALTAYLLANPRNYNLPRKFKIVFDGCPACCGLSQVNDLGFVAVRKGGQDGFRVFAGGGMGLHSRIGFCLDEFILREEAVYVTEALIRVFDKFAERKNRHRARLRFLVESLGAEEFKKRYTQELRQLKDEPLGKLAVRPQVEELQVKGSSLGRKEQIFPQDEDFKNWVGRNVSKHKDPGYYYVQVPLELGDIESERLESLALALKKLNKPHIRTSSFQNIIIPYVKEEEIGRLYLKLRELKLDAWGAQGISDIVSCMGALTCNLGICNSRGLAAALGAMLKEQRLDRCEGLQGLNIKISGCPNSCGQHPIGKIGFYGASRRHDSHNAPFYHVLLGGRIAVENSSLARECGLIPAKNIPDFLRDFLKEYLSRKLEDEDFYGYLERYGYRQAAGLLKQYERLPGFEEDKDYYFDWGKNEEFSLAGIGPGECGAGVLDMIEADLKDAGDAAKKAEYFLNNSEFSLCASQLYKVISFSSRCLLVTSGTEARSDLEAFKYFKDKFVLTGIVSDRFSDITERAWELSEKELDSRQLKELYDYSLSLLGDVAEAYKNMDSSFKFSPKIQQTQKDAVSLSLDLKGVRCPMNYVQAKLYLENLEAGQILDIYLDEGEPIQNVPESLKNDGQEILGIEKLDGYYKVRVKKLA